MDKAMTADNKKYQAESDAHTLAEAKMIMGDKMRSEAAMKAAKGMADDRMKDAKAMSDVSKADNMYPTMQKKDDMKKGGM